MAAMGRADGRSKQKTHNQSFTARSPLAWAALRCVRPSAGLAPSARLLSRPGGLEPVNSTLKISCRFMPNLQAVSSRFQPRVVGLIKLSEFGRRPFRVCWPLRMQMLRIDTAAGLLKPGLVWTLSYRAARQSAAGRRAATMILSWSLTARRSGCIGALDSAGPRMHGARLCVGWLLALPVSGSADLGAGALVHDQRCKRDSSGDVGGAHGR